MASKYRTVQWLKTNDFAPQVYLFRNIQSGQVVFSQTPHVTQYQINQQFKQPNKENKKPKVRHDLWRPLAVAHFETYESAIRAYQHLVELRHFRDISRKDEAKSLRKMNEWNRVWCSGQYRPTYTMEATADLSTALDLASDSQLKVYWDGLWWKGEDKHWNDKITHVDMERFGRREKFVILDEIKALGLNEFKTANPQEASVESSEASLA